MNSIDPKDISASEGYHLMVGAVGPRPIGFISTTNVDGNHNIAPYSFFNAFSAYPPIVGFATALKPPSKVAKDTYNNVKATGEFVVNMVTYPMVEQMNICSTNFPKQVDEFVKSGLQRIPSVKVKPQRVKSSPIHLECNLREVVDFGPDAATRYLILGDVVLIHLADSIVDDQGRIDPYHIDFVGRLGGSYYSRVNSESIFKVNRIVDNDCIGFEGLPKSIRQSEILSANELSILAKQSQKPTSDQLKQAKNNFSDFELILKNQNALHQAIKKAIDIGDINKALCLAFVD